MTFAFDTPRHYPSRSGWRNGMLHRLSWHSYHLRLL